MVKLVRGSLCVNIAAKHLRNDGRSGSVNTLGDRLGGRFSVSDGAHCQVRLALHASTTTQGIKPSIPFKSETSRVTSLVRVGSFNFRTSTPQTSAAA